MALNASFAGRTYPPSPAYEVGAEKVREFAAAVGADHPAHHDLAAAQALGYGGLLAPPTFPVIVAQRAEAQFIEDPDAGIDFSHVVHAEERFAYQRPIVAGDVLVATLDVESVTERAGIAMVTTHVAIRDESGADVCEVWSSLVVRNEEQ